MPGMLNQYTLQLSHQLDWDNIVCNKTSAENPNGRTTRVYCMNCENGVNDINKAIKQLLYLGMCALKLIFCIEIQYSIKQIS